MSASPLLNKVTPPPVDDSGTAFATARHITSYKLPVLSGVGFAPVSTSSPQNSISHKGQVMDHLFGRTPTKERITNSNPDLRNITSYPRQYPDGVTAQSNPYPLSYTEASSAFFAVVITPSWQDWGAIPAPYIPLPTGGPPRDDVDDPLIWPDDSIYPAVPISQSDNEVLNPPCGGGGTGSARPDYGVLYPRKV